VVSERIEADTIHLEVEDSLQLAAGSFNENESSSQGTEEGMEMI